MSVTSPCISVCVLNESDVCEGCYRTAEEITLWSAASDEEKHQMLEKSNERRKKDQPVRLL